MQNQAAACLVEYINKVKKRDRKFKLLNELKQQMTKEAHIEKGGQSSKEEESDEEAEDQEYGEDDEE